MKEMKRAEQERQRLETRRARVEAQWAGLQEEVRGQVGWAPRQAWMALLLLGAAAGFSLACRLRQPSRGRIESERA